jgi:hypothetical protein
MWIGVNPTSSKHDLNKFIVNVVFFYGESLLIPFLKTYCFWPPRRYGCGVWQKAKYLAALPQEEG